MGSNCESPDETSSGPPPSNSRRRASFAELFASRPNTDATKPTPSAMSTAMAQQAQEQNRSRRLSVTVLGLSGSQPHHGSQTSPFATIKRGKSVSISGDSSSRSAIEESESAIDESDTVRPLSPVEDREARGSGPGSPSSRRLSFGARAYRDARSASIAFPTGSAPAGGGVGGGGGGGSMGTGTVANASPPGIKGKGFNWTENMRTRAERASLSAASGASGMGALGHNRTKSQATCEPALPPPPPKPVHKTPDHFQERILKGDFYMD